MIHPTAIIDPRAELAPDVEVGPYAIIEGPVKLGAGTRIMAQAWISGETSLGRNCLVYPSAALGGFPQDLGFDPEKIRSSLEIGDDCVFREASTVHRSARDGGVTRVGRACYLMSCAHIGHDGRVGEGVVIANSALLAGFVEIGDHSFISGNVSIHQFVRVGRLSMIGASSYLSQDIPPFSTVQGIPGRVLGINSVGLKRKGFDARRRAEAKKIFKLIYRQGLGLNEALVELDKLASPDASLVAEFLRSSRRGIAAGRRSGHERD